MLGDRGEIRSLNKPVSNKGNEIQDQRKNEYLNWVVKSSDRHAEETKDNTSLRIFLLDAKKVAHGDEKQKEKFKPLLKLDELISRLPERPILKIKEKCNFLALIKDLYRSNNPSKDKWNEINLKAEIKIQFIEKLLGLKEGIRAFACILANWYEPFRDVVTSSSVESLESYVNKLFVLSESDYFKQNPDDLSIVVTKLSKDEVDNLKDETIIKLTLLLKSSSSDKNIQNARKLPKMIFNDVLSVEELTDLMGEPLEALGELYDLIATLFLCEQKQLDVSNVSRVRFEETVPMNLMAEEKPTEFKPQQVDSHPSFYRLTQLLAFFFEKANATTHFKKNLQMLNVLFTKMIYPALARLKHFSSDYLDFQKKRFDTVMSKCTSDGPEAFQKNIDDLFNTSYQLSYELRVFSALHRLYGVCQNHLRKTLEASYNSLSIAGLKAYDDLLSDAKQLFNFGSPYHRLELQDKISSLKCMITDISLAADVVIAPSTYLDKFKSRLEDRHLKEQPKPWERNLGGLMILCTVATAVVMLIHPPTTLFALYWWSSYGLAAAGSLLLAASSYICYQGTQPSGLARSMGDLFKRVDQNLKLENELDSKSQIRLTPQMGVSH